MDKQQALGRYWRLRHDLAAAYVAPSCQHGLIERLTTELAAVRSQIASLAGDDEQSTEQSIPGLA